MLCFGSKLSEMQQCSRANFPAFIFQSASASAALLSTIGIVLSQIELRDSILEYHFVIVVQTLLKFEIEAEGRYVWHHQRPLHCKGYLQMGSLVYKSLRILVTPLWIPAGVLYICPLVWWCTDVISWIYFRDDTAWYYLYQ